MSEFQAIDKIKNVQSKFQTHNDICAKSTEIIEIYQCLDYEFGTEIELEIVNGTAQP